ncbi:Protein DETOXIFICATION 16 [Zea mays]|uniref:Protein DETOXIFICATION n=2 Tax=Zea mays TaxID=4577 RepID=A0A8J8YSG9_MAIZE|nr:putative integral membrane protein [Zea mays]PWZ55133.1 Protein DETOXIFICATION 16 [Zea mays]
MDVPNASVEAEPLLVPRSSTEGGSAAATESKRLLRLAGPLVLSFILRNAVQMVSVMFVGHLGKLPLAGASLASSLANVTGFSLVAGMAGALDTLCGQAFGARRYALLGVYKQRSMLVLALASLPVVLTWVFVEQLLLAIGEDPDIAAEAGAYARWLIPSLAAFVPLTCHMRFLQTQSVVVPVMASSGVTALAHVLLCYTLVYKVGMGSKGAALGAAVSYSVNLAVLALYVRLSSACKATWTGFSTEAFSFSGLREYAKLAVPSAMMVCLEWWSFELLVLLSGFLPNPKLETSVLSICVNTAILLYMVPLGLGTSASTRVSNELGAGQPEAARLAARVVVCMTLCGGVVLAAIMILLRNIWGYAYSSEEDVVAYIARMLPILAVSFFVDGLNGSLSGVIIGCGKQKIGARVNLGAFYMVGIPTGLLLAFVFNLNGMGLWLGIVCGSISKLALLLWIALRIDWESEAIKAKDRVLRSSGQT